MLERYFKHEPSSEYPTTSLRSPYQYFVAMLCSLYIEPHASTFTLSLMSLIYYCEDEGSTINSIDLLSTTLTESIIVMNESMPGKILYFHMESFLLDIMCVAHQYLNMGWAW